jgi:hypothetical protein
MHTGEAGTDRLLAVMILPNSLSSVKRKRFSAVRTCASAAPKARVEKPP